MPPSSDSLSSTSLPFGADTHIHATRRRTGSVPRSVHHEYQPAVYDQGPQTHSALIADARASEAVPQIPIPPSSINDIPRSHKRILRQHHVLFWVLIGIFNISLIALTVAIVLAAVKAHQNGQNGAKCAAIIVGVFGFSGMVGSAAVIWLILTGRKERARLEKRWADEERLKEARSVRERRIESNTRESIRDRERSLSRSRSRGRDRDRVTKPAVAKISSFRGMTPTPTSSTRMPDRSTQPMSRRARSPWPRPMDVSSDGDDNPEDAIDEEKNEKSNHENDSNYNDNSDKNEDEDDGIHDEEGKARSAQKIRDSASTQFQDLDSLNSENDDDSNADTASRANIAILEKRILSNLSLAFDESKTLPALSDSGHTSPIPLNTSSTPINSSPTDPRPTVSESYNPPRLPPIEQKPFDSNIVPPNNVGIGNARSNNTTLPNIPRLEHGGLGPAQSDENFQAMLDLAEDAGSEDEDARRVRRQNIRKRVEAWESAVSLEADGREKEDRGKKLREAVARGIQRVANRKKERREVVVRFRAKVQGEGSERRE